jgi:dTDP-4-dehydrorhamnose 3,5-epimerase
MNLATTPFEGLFRIQLFEHNDLRGNFKKIFNSEQFEEYGVNFPIKEIFVSESKKDVFRGMHFQNAPKEQGKIVYCSHGRVLDFALDLRTESKTWGRLYRQELCQNDGCALLVPRGFAHGFLSLEEHSGLYYLCDEVYSQKHEDGYRCEEIWLRDFVKADVTLSARDRAFCPVPREMSLEVLF